MPAIKMPQAHESDPSHARLLFPLKGYETIAIFTPAAVKDVFMPKHTRDIIGIPTETVKMQRQKPY